MKHLLKFSSEDAEMTYWAWSFNADGYAFLSRNTNTAHRIVLRRMGVRTGKSTGKYADHINRNKLDNRRENLRMVSASRNAINVPRALNAKGYTLTKYGRFKVRIGNNYLGVYRTREAAIHARNTHLELI